MSNIDEWEASNEDTKEPVADVKAFGNLHNKHCTDSMSFNKTWWQIGDSKRTCASQSVTSLFELL